MFLSLDKMWFKNLFTRYRVYSLYENGKYTFIPEKINILEFICGKTLKYWTWDDLFRLSYFKLEDCLKQCEKYNNELTLDIEYYKKLMYENTKVPKDRL